MNLGSPFVQDAYYIPFPSGFSYRDIILQAKDAGSGQVLYTSPYYWINEEHQVQSVVMGTTLQTSSGNELHLGQSPPHWLGTFNNSDLDVRLSVAQTPYAAMFLYQGADLYPYHALPYKLYKSGSVVVSSTLPAASSFWDWNAESVIPLTTSGTYSLEVVYDQYWLGTMAGKAQVVADFDTRRADKNPPTMLSLNVFYNGETTSLVPPWATSEVRFRVQDPGGLGQVLFYYRSGDGWTSVPLTNAGDKYMGQLPGFAHRTQVSFRVIARDTAGNSLIYEVEPAIQVGIPPPVPVSPPDGWLTQRHDVAFSWEAVPQAVLYRIQIDRSTAFTSPALISATLSTTSYAATLTTGTWYWRVLAIDAGGNESEYSGMWRLEVRQPPLQVSKSSDWEERASMARGDGLLWAVWERCCSSDRLWYATSADHGDTWSEPQPLTDNAGDDGPGMATDKNGHAWLVFQSGRAGNTDIWVMHTTGGGAWTAPARVTTDPAWEGSAAIVQAADGSFLVAFQRDQAGNTDIWLTSSFDGLAWSTPVRMTTDPGYDADVELARLSDGTLWMLHHSDQSPWGLWARTSTDNGHTWSAAAPILQGYGEWQPTLAQDTSGTMWLFWLAGRSGNDDLWYATSTDNGVTWSAATQFTRFAGGDRWPHLEWLPADGGMSAGGTAAGAVGLIWGSSRHGNYDVWFARLGTHGDVNPPPYIDEVYHDPEHNPDSNDVVTVHARAADESGVEAVRLLWSLNGLPQPEMPMHDDGAHDDFNPGDRRYAAQLGPFLAGSQITYRIRATDSDGNVVTSDSFGFSILTPLSKTADILVVADYRWGSEFLPYFTRALDDVGYAYDLWECWRRGPVDQGTLLTYADGAVIWATPRDWGYLTDWPWYLKARANLEAYLNAGGSLFISGQFIAERNQGTSLLQNYLHARYVQDNVGLYQVNGMAGDPIGGGLQLGIQGGDGANDQWTPDEVDALAPAVPVFVYDSGGTAAFVEPPESDVLGKVQLGRQEVEPVPITEAELTGITSSGTAGLRVDTGTYKVVYFAFGFEGINRQTDRAEVMNRVLSWLRGALPRPMRLSPDDRVAVPTGAVRFSWTFLPGVAGYQFQLDRSADFAPPDLISVTLSTTSYTATLTAGTWYWRVRALPGGEWTAGWQVHVAAPPVRVSTSTDWEERATLAMGDGLLWAVWERCCSSDRLWYAISADHGDTWSEPQPLTDNAGDDGPSMATDKNGHAWLVFQSGRAGNTDIWVMHTTGGGAWTAPARVTTDPAWEGSAAIVQAADGSFLVAFQRDQAGNTDIWLTSSSDGLAWSTPVRMTTDPGYDADVELARLSDGTLWMLYHSDQSPWGLWARTSTDNGHTWSAAAPILQGYGEWQPALTQDASSTMWLFWRAGRSGNDDLWYATSTDHGVSWSAPTQFTRFTGGDQWPAVASLPGDHIGLLWGSNRAGNYDVWFARLGVHGDVNPPPYINDLLRNPEHRPHSNTLITILARLSDESGIADARLRWSRNGVPQPDLALYDDGGHGEFEAGDRWYAVQIGPFPAATQVKYQVVVTDTDANAVTSGSNEFNVMEPLSKTANILLVGDYRWSDNPFLPYYTAALDANDYASDVWECWVRGLVDRETLLAYADGAVIWATPRDWGYLTDSPWYWIGRANLQAYLDAGGALFITGQYVAERSRDTHVFLQEYLHARWIQDNVGLHSLLGTAGDPIGDGLSLSISGGDGANNQWTPDEVDPLAPATVVFRYNPAGPLTLIRPQPDSALLEPGRAKADAELARAGDATVSGIVSSGTAALRVDTGTYRVVYFAFGFEAINRAADRAVVMDRVLTWLGVSQPQAVLGFEPPQKSVYQCSPSFTMDVYVEDVSELAGFEFTLVFDPNIVHVQGIAMGSFITTSGRTFMTLPPDINNETGRAVFAVFSFGAEPAPSGSGAIATITFSPVATGTTTLALTQAQLTDRDANLIPALVQDGTLTVLPSLVGDLDCDCDVDIVDIMLVASHWNTRLGDPRYDARYDQDQDGDIDIVDIMRVAAHWGERCNGVASADDVAAQAPDTQVRVRQ